MPPIRKVARKPKTNLMGTVKSIDPHHAVAIQLKNLMPVGTAMSIVINMKKPSTYVFMPTVNMWCAHTVIDRNTRPKSAATIDMQPTIGLRAKTGAMSEVMLNDGD